MHAPILTEWISLFYFMLHVHYRAHSNSQIGELACGWLSLVVDNSSRRLRKIVLATPGLVSGLCTLGENGSAQARVFAGMCLKEILKGMGTECAIYTINMPGAAQEPYAAREPYIRNRFSHPRHSTQWHVTLTNTCKYMHTHVESCNTLHLHYTAHEYVRVCQRSRRASTVCCVVRCKKSD